MALEERFSPSSGLEQRGWESNLLFDSKLAPAVSGWDLLAAKQAQQPLPPAWAKIELAAKERRVKREARKRAREKMPYARSSAKRRADNNGNAMEME